MPPLLRFARYREIAAEIASHLASPSGEEIIVSSGGLATSAITELLRQSGAGTASVRVATLDLFARRVINEASEYPRIATEMERRLAMRTAIRGIADPMMTTRGIAAMLERSYRDVRDGGMSVAEFEVRTRDASLRNRRRMQMIVAVWRAYEKLIGELQAIDPADALARAATLIERQQVLLPSQMVAGFYDMTGAQLQLLAALGATGKLSTILVPVGEGEAYAFASHFIKNINAVPGPHSSVLHIKTPEISVTQYDNKEIELRSLCRSIRELLDRGTSAHQIGIVSRSLDLDDLRLLERFAGELHFTISQSIDVPLTAHRIGRGVAAILRLRDRNFPRNDVIDILRDGYMPGRRVNVDWLDMATRKARDSSVEDFRAIVSELEELTQSSASLITRSTQRFRLETEFDLSAAEAIDEIALLLRRAERWRAPFDTETILDLLEHVTLARRPTLDARPPEIWVGDIMSFRGRTFDHLFAIRMQEGSFPQRRVDDPLLPDSDRRQLGIREIGDGRDEERLLFELLLDGAGSAVHFSLAGSDGFGKVLRPSPFIKKQVVVTHPPSDNPTTRQPENLPRQLQLISRAGTRSVFDGYLGEDSLIRAKILEELRSISPTDLEDFGECPQKFLWKHILDVTDYDDPERELQMHHREKGKLDHTILERFYRTVDANALARAKWFLPQLAPDLRERIDGLIDSAFDEEEARVPPFNRVMRQIERRATKRNLHAFLAEDIGDLLANELRPTHYEYKFGTKYAKRGAVDHIEPFRITANGVPIEVQGSIDRIDTGAGQMRIVDYKSGKALRHVHLAEKIDRGVRLQLALYAMAVAEFFNVDSKTISGAIKPLVVRGSDGDKLRFALGEAEPRLRETLDVFIASMLRCAFPAFPNDDDKEKNFNACKYCPVNHSCRTKHADAERRVVLRQKDPRTLLESLP